MSDHTCDACGGTGDANDYRPACSNDAHGDGCGCGDAPFPCPVCLGEGRFPDRMPVADAMADAETLRLALIEHDRLSHGLGMTDCEWVVRDSYARLRNPDGVARCEVAIEARAAFRAVPGLRG